MRGLRVVVEAQRAARAAPGWRPRRSGSRGTTSSRSACARSIGRAVAHLQVARAAAPHRGACRARRARRATSCCAARASPCISSGVSWPAVVHVPPAARVGLHASRCARRSRPAPGRASRANGRAGNSSSNCTRKARASDLMRFAMLPGRHRFRKPRLRGARILRQRPERPGGAREEEEEGDHQRHRLQQQRARGPSRSPRRGRAPHAIEPHQVATKIQTQASMYRPIGIVCEKRKFVITRKKPR